MGNKDLSEKILEDYSDVFADIFNVLVFKGEQRIKPSALRNTSVHSMYKADDSTLHEQERDIAKFWTDSRVKLAICGIENQTTIDRKMPLRVAGYEGASYRSQIKDKHPVPVITIVLYFGTKHWKNSKSIKELVNIPNGLDDYVNDTRIHVFEISWLTDSQINLFKSDFKVVANFFVNKRKNPDYIPDDRTEIKHVDEVLKLLSVMTKDLRYESVRTDEKGKVKSMCEVAQRLINTGLAKGREEGRSEGREEGRREGQNLLVKAIQELKCGKSDADLRSEGFDENTIQLALSCR